MCWQMDEKTQTTVLCPPARPGFAYISLLYMNAWDTECLCAILKNWQGSMKAYDLILTLLTACEFVNCEYEALQCAAKKIKEI